MISCAQNVWNLLQVTILWSPRISERTLGLLQLTLPHLVSIQSTQTCHFPGLYWVFQSMIDETTSCFCASTYIRKSFIPISFWRLCCDNQVTLFPECLTFLTFWCLKICPLSLSKWVTTLNFSLRDSNRNRTDLFIVSLAIYLDGLYCAGLGEIAPVWKNLNWSLAIENWNKVIFWRLKDCEGSQSIICCIMVAFHVLDVQHSKGYQSMEVG